MLVTHKQALRFVAAVWAMAFAVLFTLCLFSVFMNWLVRAG